ncbi:MAG: hypothetical protein HUU20_09685 [Pirellulales bacterium]|nr:hypothetical protein [Pirellulales bacterium]
MVTPFPKEPNHERAPSEIEALFLAALEKPTPGERVAYLDDACAGNLELRRQVESFLRAHEEAGSFIKLFVTLYEQSGKPDLAAEWRAKLGPAQAGTPQARVSAEAEGSNPAEPSSEASAG